MSGGCCRAVHNKSNRIVTLFARPSKYITICALSKYYLNQKNDVLTSNKFKCGESLRCTGIGWIVAPLAIASTIKDLVIRLRFLTGWDGPLSPSTFGSSSEDIWKLEINPDSVILRRHNISKMFSFKKNSFKNAYLNYK